jgi:hypothetical protein
MHSPEKSTRYRMGMSVELVMFKRSECLRHGGIYSIGLASAALGWLFSDGSPNSFIFTSSSSPHDHIEELAHGPRTKMYVFKWFDIMFFNSGRGTP